MGLWKARVLVVDRDSETVEAIRRILSATGAEVAGVASGADAAVLLARSRPDVVLVDVGNTPADLRATSDGFATMQQIRTLSPEDGGRTPSASLGPSLWNDPLLDRWRRSGFQLHVSKPVDPEELKAVVETLAGWDIERRRGTFGPQQPREGFERRVLV